MTIKYCLIIAQVDGRWATLGYRRSIWAQIGNFSALSPLGAWLFHHPRQSVIIIRRLALQGCQNCCALARE